MFKIITQKSITAFLFFALATSNTHAASRTFSYNPQGIMQEVRNNTLFSSSPKSKQASVGNRLIAEVVGGFLFSIVEVVAMGVAYTGVIMFFVFHPATGVITGIIATAGLLALPIGWELKQVNKSIFNMQIVDEQGNPADISTIAVRALCKYCLGILSPLGLLTEDGRFFHDQLTNTYVVWI